jgi:transcriptional regulator with XRE-family HTH domain
MTAPQQWIDNNGQQPAMYLHQNIRALRKKLSLSQEELATRVGLNRGNIASYENGTAEPRICNLLKLSHIFNVPVIDLTHKDLSASNGAVEGLVVQNGHNHQEPDVLKHFHDRADEISQVIHSLYTCFQFKLKSLPESSPEIQAIQVHFEQLREASQSLIEDHRALLDFVKRLQ